MADTWKSVFEEARSNRPICTMYSFNRKILLLLYESSIEIRSKKSETIPFSAIVGIEIKSPTRFSNGVLTIKLNKSSTGYMSFSSMTVGFGSEIQIVFSQENSDLANRIKQTFASYFDKPEAPTVQVPVPASVSVADEIRNFKQLMDDGIITAEEFEAKKKQLLGL